MMVKQLKKELLVVVRDFKRMRQEGKIRSKLKEGLRSPRNAGGMSRSLYFDSLSFLSITHEQSKKNGGQNFENNNGLF